MKAKYLIIFILVLLLGFVVAEMLRLEERIRESKVVEVILEDVNKPLMEELSVEQLRRLADSSEHFFRAEGDYFSAITTKINRGIKRQVWEETFIKGVNMGVALPGNWPSEFAASYEQYLEWFIMIGQMNSNTIRTYTILPPDFYKALAFYNLHYENRKLWLMQGVWADEPPKENYADAGYTRKFLTEIRDAIDVVHGNIVIPPKHGHADGAYTADVSRYTIGWALGREWEPHAVAKTNQNDSIDLPYGVFIDVLKGNPMEKWLAGVMEFTARYETQTYLSQRPISFINWLTLDPMYHNREMGVDDLETVDIEKFSHTNLFKPGLFASYHVYPYYPDYIFLGDRYRDTIPVLGKPDNFLAYLLDLKKHQQGMPLVIAEYGVPTSRGNSHYTPFEYHHGGYSEQEQADVSVLMTEHIHTSGCAGALYFEWIDEWFKNNWLVQEFEEPQERRKLWFNVENPEQNYGIIAMEARKRHIDGNPADWNKDLRKPFIAAESDPAYFYLAANMPSVDFSKHNLYIAIDTHDKKRGGFRLPWTDQKLDRGVEFLVEVKGVNQAQVLVDHHYNVYSNRFAEEWPDYKSVKNSDAKFTEQWLLSNPARIDVLGDTSEIVKHNRGKLQFGNSQLPATSNAGIFWTKSGFLEMRISWQVLNVADPSSRLVIDGVNPDRTLALSETDGFHLRFFVLDKKNNPVSSYPDGKSLWYTWKKWEVPEYSARTKPVYHALADIFHRLKPSDISKSYDTPGDHLFTLSDYYRGLPGAITFAFDGRCHSQLSNALPKLAKYNLRATFSKSYYGPAITGGTHYLQMLDEEFQVLEKANHEVRPAGPWVMESGNREMIVASPWKGAHPFFRIRDDRSPTLHQMDSILRNGENRWNIFLFRHVYDTLTRAHKNLLHLAGRKVDNVNPDHFEKLIRIGRNTGFWVAPFEEVANYLYVRERSKINRSGYNNLFFVTITNQLEAIFNHRPITIKYHGPAKIIRISGSASDGTFRVRQGVLFLDLWPNQEATIEVLESN
jgi:hypothetical protein